MTDELVVGQKLIEASRRGDLSQVPSESVTLLSGSSCDRFKLRAFFQVDSYLRSGVDAAYQDISDGSSPLIAAASSGHAEVVSRLLVAGAPWNAFDRQANCAGDYAIAGQHQDCIDILLSAGDASCVRGILHYQPHRFAVKSQISQEHQALIYHANCYGNNPPRRGYQCCDN